MNQGYIACKPGCNSFQRVWWCLWVGVLECGLGISIIFLPSFAARTNTQNRERGSVPVKRTHTHKERRIPVGLKLNSYHVRAGTGFNSVYWHLLTGGKLNSTGLFHHGQQVRPSALSFSLSFIGFGLSGEGPELPLISLVICLSASLCSSEFARMCLCSRIF